MDLGSNVSGELECSVCMGRCQDPTRPTSCTHVFCRSCLTQSLRIRPHCPFCRAPADEKLIFPATDVLPLTVPATDTRRDSRSEVRERLRRHGAAPPLLDPFAAVSSRRVSPNIQDLLRRLGESVEASQNAPSAAPRDPPAPLVLPAPPPVIQALPQTPPQVPPRGASRARRFPFFALPTAPSNQAPVAPPLITAPVMSLPLPTLPNTGGPLDPLPQDYLSSPSSASSSSSDEEYMDDDFSEIDILQLTHSSSAQTLFNCPYCQEGGLDELGLLLHCNANHRADPRSVVCPICVSLPHGDPTYHSVNFIGHMNRRHRYYNTDFMDVNQSESINEQAAILASYNSLIQNQ
ncbi:hypothetical protein GJAV_G00068490 [Gymnothorax javanicus]|nr:hypothetical protein GJAV_G00068490 [Gymnothorax javanicus]